MRAPKAVHAPAAHAEGEGQAKHVQESEQKRGKSKDEAKRIGYATVNKQKKSK